MQYQRRELIFIIPAILFIICSCSNPGMGNLDIPNNQTRDALPTSGASQSAHHLWGYYLVGYDPATGNPEITAARDASTHWNVLQLLEQGPCTNCVKLKKMKPSGNGTVLVDIEITHPCLSAEWTGFDIRGICMFDGALSFPAAGLIASDRHSGEGELVNADGYTSLYNWTTSGSGPGGMQGYMKGHLATPQMPSATLNGYKRYSSADVTNFRNAFYANTSTTRTYELDMPDSSWIFGYAVDACWAPASKKPVEDPMVDFPLNANCPEPWRIEVSAQPIGPGLTTKGGQAKLTIKVYDYQGNDSHEIPYIECPSLWNGLVGATWVSDETVPSQHSIYEAIVGNTNLATIGEYKCLVSVEDEKNATAPPWLDLTAYNVIPLTVKEGVQQHELWYMEMTNLLVDARLAEAIARLQEAYDAGYRTVMLSDFKFGTIDIQSDTYYQHVQQYVQAAENVGMEIVPSLVNIGYSGAVLCHDPNLIEAQPVVDCVFQVNGYTADVLQDTATKIVNGDFENHNGDTFPGWIQMDGIGVETFADTSVKHSGNASIRYENFKAQPYGNDRIRQEVDVAPWNCYAITFWVRTEGLSPADEFRVQVFSPDISDTLEFLSYDVKSNQGWTKYHAIFNSQDYETVQVYIGIWGGEGGKFWVDDVTIENTGLINLVRRDGTPFEVTNLDGSIVYQEGVDYYPVSDPLMGNAGTYTGTFDLYHERPVIELTPDSSIQSGQRLLVDYYHAVFVYDLQEACCLTEDAVFDIFQSTLSMINELIHPSQVFMSVDELRVVNWCAKCQSTGKTPGRLLADATQRIDDIAHSINPSWEIIVWSDMYDPGHNAHDGYYLANGTLSGSWEGLPSSWDIANWLRLNTDTLAWFESLGHNQVLCGFYDESGPNYSITDWLDMSKDYPGVYGVMYTTWNHDFSHLAAWAQAVKNWDEQNW